MAKKAVPTAIEELLVSNAPFEYAHLVKFERPFKPDPDTLEFRTNANRYAYFTDASRDISFNDGSIDHDGFSNGAQIYRANRVKSIGSYSETTSPRATNMSLVLSGEHLGTSISITGDFSSNSFTVNSTFHNDADSTDLVDFGFREGDKITITKNSGNFSNGSNSVSYIIASFATDNRKMVFETTGNDTDDSQSYPTDTSVSVTITLDSGELTSILDEKVITSLVNPTFLNREVFIHKVFIDPETGNIVGDSSIVIFKGIVAGCSISESEQSSQVKWNLTSHWGDWEAVGGRLTIDDVHRALDGKGQPNPLVALKPEYATDLGFIHSETTLNAIANYKTYETKQNVQVKDRGIGLTQKTLVREVQVEIDNEVDLNIGLQGKYLPVVYGVRRLGGIPVFADTANDASNIVFIADAICEGEIFGLYNLYIDGVPLICTDESDYGIRSAAAGTDKDNSQLQCYGRADIGNTLGGVGDESIASSTASYYNNTVEIADEMDQGQAETLKFNIQNQTSFYYPTLSTSNIPLLSTSDATGLQHQEYGTIDHPNSMSFAFFKGSNSQRASSLLVSQAEGAGFKRQKDYYEDTIPYWSPDHRLLDTAYCANSFVINEGQTEIPELEYVVRGRVIECFNFDNSYVPDSVLGSSDDHTNFNEGDTVTVERSSNGTSWETTGVEGFNSDTSFRILHKYLFTNNDGTSFQRILLDQTPDLDAVDGVPSKTYLRLKQTGANNYWHMRTYNHRNLTNESFALYAKNPTSVTKNASNELVFTFSSSTPDDVTLLQAGYTDELANKPGLATYSVLVNNCTGLNVLSENQNNSFVGVWDGNDLTLKGLTYTPDISNLTNTTSLQIYKNRNFYMGGSGGPFYGFNSDSDFTGATITLKTPAGEESRKIESYTAGEKRIEIEAPFQLLREDYYDAGKIKFDISGVQGDLRASINPTLQLLDFMRDKRYGKGLNLERDIDLASFISSAKLCEVRGTVTIGVATTDLITVGDYYRLENSSGDHIGSGRIKSIDTSAKTVTFENLSGKFVRTYGNHLNYLADEYIIVDNRLYKSVSGGYISTKPTHTSGTVSNLEYITNGMVTLTKESGSGPSSISLSLVSGNSTDFLPEYSLYDSDFIKYWRYLGWEHHKQCFVTRHQTNFIIDTSKSIFENMNVILSHMNGILSYESGKYVLDIETAATAPVVNNTFNSVNYDWNVNPEYIDNNDIIGSINLTDNSVRNAKNTIKASIPDPATGFNSRSVSFYDSDFLEADRKVVKSGNLSYTGITNYFACRMNTKLALTKTRFTREINFKVGTKGLLLKAGQVIALTYEPFKFSSKLFRINNLNFNPDCTVSIKATEYDDSIYVIDAARANELRQEASTQSATLIAPGAATSLAATTDKPGAIILSWNNPSNFTDETDDIEIWASDDNNRGNAELIAIADNETVYPHLLSTATTKYYWIRIRRLSKRNRETTILTSPFHPTSATGGVEGSSKVLSPLIQLNVSSITIKFDESGALSPSGTSQDQLIDVSLQNLSNTPTIALLESNGSTQTDVQFTDGSTSVSGTQATLDASTFSVNTSPKVIRVTVSENGENFITNVPIAVVKDGADGIDGIDGSDGAPGPAGVRDGGVFSFEESATAGLSAAQVTTWVGTLDDSTANAIAALVIASANDSTIRPNDRITIIDASEQKTGTRIYNGTATTSNTDADAADFSSLVIEYFDGSVIVDGTLSADKITSNTNFTNNLSVSSALTLGATGGTGVFKTPGKDSFTDTTDGFYLDTSGNFYLGNATNYLKYQAGGTVSLAGNFSLAGPPGTPGSDGSDGTDGTDGSNGTNGTPGTPGSDGTDGTNGTPGSDGGPGPTGATGPTGPTGPTGSNAVMPAIFYVPLGDNNAPTNSEFSAVAGRNPINGDVAIVVVAGGTSKAYRYSGSWSQVTAFIDGNMVVSGSITATEIAVNTISADRIKVNEIVLPSSGVALTTIGPWSTNTFSYQFVGSVGSGAGFYHGYVRLVGSTNHVKTVSLVYFDSGNSTIIYNSGLTSKLPGQVDRFFSSSDSANIPQAFTYTGSNTVNLFVLAQGDSYPDYLQAEARFYKYST